MTATEQSQHEEYMRRCIALAEAARARGDTAVGSLVVYNDAIIAEASETVPSSLDVTGHAEVLAIRQACVALNTINLRGCTLYTTAEPCWMCSYAIRESNISMVVIGDTTPYVGGVTSQYAMLLEIVPGWTAPPRIVQGILQGECRVLHSSHPSHN